MHHADAGLQRVEGGIENGLLPVQQDLPLIAAGFADHVHAEQDLHERALARAVFAHQADDLPLPQGQVDIGQDLVAEEILPDVPHLEERYVLTHLIIHPTLSCPS